MFTSVSRNLPTALSSSQQKKKKRWKEPVVAYFTPSIPFVALESSYPSHHSTKNALAKVKTHLLGTKFRVTFHLTQSLWNTYLRLTNYIYFNCCSCWDAFVASSSPCLSALEHLSALVAMFFYSLILMVKILSKRDLERDLLNFIRVTYKNPTDSVMHRAKDWMLCP